MKSEKREIKRERKEKKVERKITLKDIYDDAWLAGWNACRDTYVRGSASAAANGAKRGVKDKRKVNEAKAKAYKIQQKQSLRGYSYDLV
ncbi:MAG: hypothetical protein SPL13_04255 [Clostridia bacterium]|nr:hypothetical protein [Clostridia bacterium]